MRNCRLSKLIALALCAASCWSELAIAQSNPDSSQAENALKHLRLTYVWPEPKTSRFHALMEKTATGWIVVALSDKQDILREKPEQEVLYVRSDFGHVQPHFEKVEKISGGQFFDCNTFGQKSKAYTPCNSAFTKVQSLGTALKGVVAVMSLGMESGTVRVVDENEVLSAVKQSNLFGKILENQARISAERELLVYRQAFDAIRTIPQCDDFINKYAKYDPDGRVVLAVARRETLLAQQEESNQRQEILRAEQARTAAMERQKEIIRVTAFRLGLKAETRTNCGPVLEMKSTLVKVYFPVANYGTEHWIKKDSLFPPEFECRFINGNYVSPLL